MKRIHIAGGLSLPLEAATQTFAILAKRGVGKTYTSAVITEQMLKVGIPVVILDPIGVWWGLRSSANGKRAGLPITIFGGDHADVPLESTAGETIANLVVDERISAVLDLSRFRKAEQMRFVTALAERLYHKNRKPLHVVMDEADSFAPQRPHHGEERMLGAFEDIVRRGRARGLGITMVTQRSAVLNKNVLTQAEVLIVLRTIASQDRDAIDSWIDVHGDKDKRKQMMDSLASLDIGEAWFWSPGWLDVFKRIKVDKRETFDSSATPKFGGRIREPKRLAAVDLDRIRARIADTIERAKQDDPRELKRQVMELQGKLAKATRPVAMGKIKTVYKEIPVMGKRELGKLIKGIADARKSIKWLGVTMDTLLPTLAKLTDAMKPREEFEELKPAAKETMVTPTVPVKVKRDPVVAVDDADKLMAGERRMVEVLAKVQPDSLDTTQLATLSGLAPNSGTTRNYFGKLRRLKYVTMVAGGRVHLNSIPFGIDNMPLNHDEVIAAWKDKLQAGERRMFDVLLGLHGKSISQEGLGTESGMAYPSGSFRNYLGTLRRNGLAIMDGTMVKLADIMNMVSFK